MKQKSWAEWPPLAEAAQDDVLSLSYLPSVKLHLRCAEQGLWMVESEMTSTRKTGREGHDECSVVGSM